MYEAGIAMSGLSCFINGDLARDLANDIMSLVSEEIALYWEAFPLALDDIYETIYSKTSSTSSVQSLFK